MKDFLCSYYTNSDDITSYMTNKIGIASNDVILEPSAGEGIFVDALLKKGFHIKIDALDIDSNAINVLESKYKNNSLVNVRQTDTLLDDQLDLYANCNGYYDKIIGNPPYGAWQDYDKRDFLKKKYNGHYVKETYSLFLLRCVTLLKEHGRMSFIIPDTFLFLNNHSKLREFLLKNTKIEEILIFPSKFFPGISFGYSNLSIITLERSEEVEAINNEVRIIKGFESSSEFSKLFDNEGVYGTLQVSILKQKDIISNDNYRFILADNATINKINKSVDKLGDVASVVTGLYTGDNKSFIRVLCNNVKGGKSYSELNDALLYSCSSAKGIDNVSEGYIPYIKSASPTRYYRNSDEWFVRWDKAAIDFYNTNKKARFQNSAFYFKRGIAIPMVKSRMIRAFLIENRVFDQSIVGIFPKDQSKLYYILALMNSDAINRLIHTINPTANNSANYIKQIPYIEPEDDTLESISGMVEDIIKYTKIGVLDKCETLHAKINSIIEGIYS